MRSYTTGHLSIAVLCVSLAASGGCEPGAATTGEGADGELVAGDDMSAGGELAIGVEIRFDQEQPVSESDAAFRVWLEDKVRLSLDIENELYYAYYDVSTDEAWFVSLMVSADVLRYWLDRGELAAAVRVGNGLLQFQHDGTGRLGNRYQGAFPSAVEDKQGRWLAAPYYDSADNLAIIEALLDLYDATGQMRFRDAAFAAGEWIRDVMAHGERWNLWLEAYGVPMRAMNGAGDFDNRLPVGRTLFWLPTLRRLAGLSGDAAYAEIAEVSRAFLSRGQVSGGGFPDHYEPGWPPQPFDSSRFVAVGLDGSVYADDSIRAAIGMAAEGYLEAALRLGASLDGSAGIAGYIDMEKAEGLFGARDEPYYDVISSALYRELGARVGLNTDRADAFLAASQSDNGGWYWGRSVSTGGPITPDQATLTGLWALTDLQPRSPETWK